MLCDKLIGHRIGYTARRFQAFFIAKLEDYHLNFEQGVLLFMLFENPNVQLNHIAQELNKNKATISRAIHSLIKKGFVKKIRAQDDRRVLILTLTPAAHDVLQRLIEIFERLDGIFREHFTQEELDLCFDVLERIGERLDKELGIT